MTIIFIVFFIQTFARVVVARKKWQIILILSCIYSANTSFAANSYQIIFSTDLIRHGDRTPLKEIPNDSHQWSEGLGYLTPAGMSQLYQEGRLLRSLYVEQYHLLPSNYLSGAMYVRSTNLERNLVSAESLLLGLYPPGTGPKLAGQRKFALPNGFQPIPIHTVSINADPVLLPERIWRKQFNKLVYRYAYMQPDFIKQENILRPQLKNWSTKIGYKMTLLENVVAMGNTLYIRQLHGIALPPKITQQDANQLIQLSQQILTMAYKPTPVGKFMIRELVKEIKTNMQAAAAQQTPLKYALYLGHDINILGMMSALGMPLQTLPPYGADVRLELLQDNQQHFWVRVTYNNQVQQIPKCGTLCPMQQFFKILQS